jgi:hypothetical protein
MRIQKLDPKFDDDPKPGSKFDDDPKTGSKVG